MIVDSIEPSSRFEKRWRRLPHEIKEKAKKIILLFRKDPFHPSLRLHRLSGKLKQYWSISIDLKYRIIFRMDDGTAIFFSVGTHAIYGKS
jgi:mRNA-degrading endonuclease YafQ of YafQ-DinJ toxin-antitoxin module